MMKHNKSGGFALVIALSLMAFVLLLLLSITTMVQVETAVSAQTKHQLEARENAKLAAMVALGRLQKLTGPDQRVTARAEILHPPSSDLSDSGGIDGQTMWTGVWSSKENTNDPDDLVVGLDQERPQWLVSGADPDALTPAGQNDDLIELVSNNAVTSNRLRVEVLLEDIVTDGEANAGRFAYWVSDEGVKARINSGNPYVDANGDDSDEGYYNSAVPQVMDPTVSSDYFSDPSNPKRYFENDLSYWKESNSSATKIASYSDLKFISSDVTENAMRAHVHDFTTLSSSLLVNTKNGGLKVDLSTALLDPKQNGLEGPMFPPASGKNTDVGGDPGGPLWEQLADYYDYTVDPDRVIPPVKHANDRINFAPILTRFQYEIHGFAFQRSGNGGDETIDNNRADFFEYSVGIFPLVTLWNPYDREMPIPEMQLLVQVGRSWEIVDSSTGFTGVGRPVMKPIDQTSDTIIPADEGGSRHMLCFTIGPSTEVQTLQPGEAINFRAPHNSWLATKNYVNDYPSRSIAQPTNYLKPGSFEGGQLWGFFTKEVRDEGDATQGKLRTKLRLKQIGATNLWRKIVSLYVLEDGDDRFDVNNYNTDTRIGTYTYDANAWLSSANADILPGFDKTGQYRVDGEGNFRFNNPDHIAEVGSSEDYEPQPYVDVSHINRDALALQNSLYQQGEDTIDRRTWGQAFMMLFPQTDFFTLNEADLLGRPHLYSQFNPRSPTFNANASIYKQSNSDLRYRMLGIGPDRLTDPTAVNIYNAQATQGDLDKHYKGFVGVSNEVLSFSGDDGKAILYEYPVEPPLGIGQLMHANLMNVDLLTNAYEGGWNRNMQQPHTSPTYAIGNSFASVQLGLDEVSAVIDGSHFDGGSPGNYSGAHYDYSYLLNDLLWDGYFFSSILPDNTSPSTGGFPNSRMTLLEVVDDESELLNPETAASHLAIEGGFNINSTSVAAWEAVLGAMRDVDVLPSENANDPLGGLLHNYSRFSRPSTPSAPDTPSYDADEASISTGYRALSDDQVSSLAREIVKEIRTRSSQRDLPFRSLSEFINRSIDDRDIADANRKRFSYCGPLQFAIDQSSLNGDAALDESWDRQDKGTGLWENGLLERPYITPKLPSPGSSGALDADSLQVINGRPYTEGLPGAMTQADLLSKLGSVLCARSDTFTIRSYGSSTDRITDETLAEAYCDMVVQRVPEYVDSSADESYQLPSNRINRQFGRQFRIVSYRFVSKDEI